MSKICHHNEKPSETGLFTRGQNMIADRQTSKMPSTTSGAGQTETNLGKQKRGCFDSEINWRVICSRVFMPLMFSITNIFCTKWNNFHNMHQNGSILVCLALTCLQMINRKFCACKFRKNNGQQIVALILACCWRTRKKEKNTARILCGNIFDIPRVTALLGFCGCKQHLGEKLPRAHRMVWCFFHRFCSQVCL